VHASGELQRVLRNTDARRSAPRRVEEMPEVGRGVSRGVSRAFRGEGVMEIPHGKDRIGYVYGYYLCIWILFMHMEFYGYIIFIDIIYMYKDPIIQYIIYRWIYGCNDMICI
jgi:hypothetical protein